jgi:hypothetical protein
MLLNRYGRPMAPGLVPGVAVSAGLTSARAVPLVGHAVNAASRLRSPQTNLPDWQPGMWGTGPAPEVRGFTSSDAPVGGAPPGGTPPPTTPVITPEGDGSGSATGPIDQSTRRWQLGDGPRIQQAQRLGGAAALAAKAAAGLAIPAALALPAFAAGAGAESEYGEAGGVVSGGASLAGGAAGMMLGGELGELAIPGGRRFNGVARKIGAALGALAGGGAGAALGGAANAGAKGMVDRYAAGSDSISGQIGGMLDAAGYRSSRDIEEQQINAARNSPTYLLAQQQQQRLQEQQRQQMIERLYYGALSAGVG